MSLTETDRPLPVGPAISTRGLQSPQRQLPHTELLPSGATRTWTSAADRLALLLVDRDDSVVAFRRELHNAVTLLRWRGYGAAHPMEPGLALASLADSLGVTVAAVAYGQRLASGPEVIALRLPAPDGVVQLYAVMSDDSTVVVGWDCFKHTAR